MEKRQEIGRGYIVGSAPPRYAGRTVRNRCGGNAIAFAFLMWAIVLPGAPGSAQEGPQDGQPAEEDAPLTTGGVLEISFTPTERAQLALWVERADGEFLATVRLTESVAYRGIGNRPGASQMNSGFRWPYGRREGVLPVWAHRRASAPGARHFRTVIFQDRISEGLASRTSSDFSRDDYYCLSFDRTRSRQDALDAVSCASVFSSDKGRFMTDGDVQASYAEPYQDVGTGAGRMRPLLPHSLYPPRRDVIPCEGACFDHSDVALFASHAREVMPDIDAVTMATPVGGIEQHILFPVPADWGDGQVRVCVEANVEGDYNPAFNAELYPTPLMPIDKWDTWATGYGYPYRGQPSVVYCADVTLGGDELASFAALEPEGTVGTWDVEGDGYGTLLPMDQMTDDPVGAPGSGADRLHLMGDGYRVGVTVKPPVSCMEDPPPGEVANLSVDNHHDELQAHQFAQLQFEAADDDRGIFRYDVRVSTEPITDNTSFMAAQPAKGATVEAEELLVPTDAPPGSMIKVEMGGLVQETHYYVAVRAMDECAGVGPIAVSEVTTSERIFATVTPCFVATAAWGSPMAEEIGSLRRFRDRHLLTHPIGRGLVSAYYSVGPALADGIAGDDTLRSAARTMLRPVVALVRWLED